MASHLPAQALQTFQPTEMTNHTACSCAVAGNVRLRTCSDAEWHAWLSWAKGRASQVVLILSSPPKCLPHQLIL